MAPYSGDVQDRFSSFSMPRIARSDANRESVFLSEEGLTVLCTRIINEDHALYYGDFKNVIEVTHIAPYKP